MTNAIIGVLLIGAVVPAYGIIMATKDSMFNKMSNPDQMRLAGFFIGVGYTLVLWPLITALILHN